MLSLVRARLVVEEERERKLVYEIAHPLVQETIYRGIGGARRRALHRLIGRALVARGRFGAAAPHYARSAEPGDGEAIEALRDAIRQAESQQACTEALTILNALVDLLPRGDTRWLEVFDAWHGARSGLPITGRTSRRRMGIKAMRAIDALLDQHPDPVITCMLLSGYCRGSSWRRVMWAAGSRRASRGR